MREARQSREAAPDGRARGLLASNRILLLTGKGSVRRRLLRAKAKPFGTGSGASARAECQDPANLPRGIFVARAKKVLDGDGGTG